MDYTSFANERTIELTIVPILRKILKHRYSVIAPIYPWRTREGNSFSQLLHKDDTFKVLGLYSRRPKFNEKNDNLAITVNPELLELSAIAEKQNIPFIAGSIWSRSFFELNESASCIWLKLNSKTDSFYELKNNNDIRGEYGADPADTFLSDIEIINYIESFNKYFTINEFFSTLDVIRLNTTVRHTFYGPRYKPLYFLLKE